MARTTRNIIYILHGQAQKSYHQRNSLINSYVQNNGLKPRNCIPNYILASGIGNSQCWNTPKFAPGGSQESSHRNGKNTTCIFDRTYWTNARLQVTVSWTGSLLMMWCHDMLGARIKMVVHDGAVWISHQIKSSRHIPQQVNCHFPELRQTTNSEQYIVMLSWSSKF